MIRRLVVLALLAVATLGVGVLPAHAASVTAPTVGECFGDPPTPEDPASAGFLSMAFPRPVQLPREADPFDPNSGTTIMEQYGPAGMVWHTYDTGCGVGTEYLPNALTTIANLGTLAPRFAVAFTASVANLTLDPTWLKALDEPVNTVGRRLGETVGTNYLPLTLLLAAAVLLWLAFKGRFGKATITIVYALVAVGLLWLGMRGPAAVGSRVDGFISTVAAEAMGGTTVGADRAQYGTRAVAPVWDVVAYDRWLEGNLGSATSKTATEFGPRLFKAQTLSWAESDRAAASSAERTRIYDAKKRDWAAAAAQIKATDPAAYAFLTGTKGETRLGTAVGANLAALATVPFTMVALCLVLMGYLVLRFLLGFSPVFAVLVVVFSSLLRTLGQIAGAALINTAVFAAAAGAVLTITGAVLRADIHQVLAMVIALALSLIAWIVLAPFRTVTRMVSNPSQALTSATEAPQRAWGVGKRLVGRAAGSYLGSKAALSDIEDELDDDEKPRRPESSRPEVTIRPTQPTTPREVPIEGEVVDEQPQRQWGWFTAPARPHPATVSPYALPPAPQPAPEQERSTEAWPTEYPVDSAEDGSWISYEPQSGQMVVHVGSPARKVDL